MITKRLHFAFFILSAAAAVLIGRLFSLQVNEHPLFSAFARGQQQVSEEVLPERGKIFGRNLDGTLVTFAANKQFPLVYAVPQRIEDVAEAEKLLAKVLALNDEDREVLREKLSDAEDPYELIADKLSDEQVAQVEEAALPGVSIAYARERFYPHRERLADTVGFVGFDAEGSRRGVYGIEAYFEEVLRGEAGKVKGERDGQGVLLEAFSEEGALPLPGADVVLTVDANIQYQAEQALKTAVERWGASGGTVLVMEPDTGNIRAVANEPTFDLNQYGKVADANMYLNEAIAVPYEPGSVFKPVTMAAAIDSGVITPETTYENTGSIKIGSYTVSNTLQQYNGERTMVEALQYSLNTGAIFAAEALGYKNFLTYIEAFGFGQPTGVTFSNEPAGSIAHVRSGRAINLATASFGQGISVTPLQLASAIGIIANNGKLMRPKLVEYIEHPTGEKEQMPTEEVRQVISERTAIRLAAMMTRVVEHGTGELAQVPGYTIAGKTGTAQIPNVGSPGYAQGHNHTFVGFFPAFDPEFVILVKLVRPKARYASTTAAPVFKELTEYLISYAAIPPDTPTESE